MFKNILNNRFFLIVFPCLLMTVGSTPYGVWPFNLFVAMFFNRLIVISPNSRRAFLDGFLASFVMMLTGFYWVVYVIHEFGRLPWVISALVYIGFCGFGALNYPVFMALGSWCYRRFGLEQTKGNLQATWFIFILPCLFTVCEYFIPKLFPWYFGHSLYRTPSLIQISDITGSIFLSFCLYSLGGAFGLTVYPARNLDKKAALRWTLVPTALWLVVLVYGFVRMASLSKENESNNKSLVFALIQPNIGSLEKVLARKGVGERVHHVVETYKQMTEAALQGNPRPDIVVWPETAMPFQLEGDRYYPKLIRSWVEQWGVRLVSGAYAPHPVHVFADYNAAFLLEPTAGGVKTQVYLKNVLLAFGEYMPGGEWFPKLYEWFPEVSRFERGTEQKPFILSDGTRLGITVCYEAIIPSFVRKVAKENVQAILNLTNDSWFGPTGEPYQHGSLALFRAVEFRVPLVRVTNTGVSFFVDELGQMSQMTGVYEAGTLVRRIKIPATPPRTFYLMTGDWFIYFCALAVIAFIVYLSRNKRKYASLPN